MANFAYYNGTYQPHEGLSVPLSDRALYFGDGVYDVIVVGDGRAYQFDEHFTRLTGNCRAIGIPFSTTKRELLAIIHRLCDLSQLTQAVAYVQVSRSSVRRMHEIEADSGANLLVTVFPFSSYSDRTVSAITLRDERHGICNVKTLNLLCSVLALNEARARGCDCAIFVRDGVVTEEARSNVSIIRCGTLITHPTDRHILPGIMRSNLIRAAQGIGMAVVERPFTEEEMISSDEIIVSSTTKFIYRVSKINGIRVGFNDENAYFTMRERLVMDFLHETG